MTISIISHNGSKLAHVTSDKIVLGNAQDAVELIANCQYNDADKIIIHASNLHADFFDLKTRVAGEILQKFSTYRAQLAIVGDFADIQSKSLKDFIYESNRSGHICFVSNLEEAKQKLAHQ